MLLGALEYGICGCIIGSFERNELRKILRIPEEYVLHCVISLGYAAEKSVAEDEQGSIKYYKDQDGVMHVPKRRLKDILHINKISR